MDAIPIPTKRWARLEYERLVDRAVFQPGDRVELVGGQLLVREPQGSPHAVAVQLAEDALRVAFEPGWVVRVQMPVALDDESEPEPDVAVCAGSPRDYLAGHPSRPVLLVEMAEASLAFDREHKGSLYARAHVPEYWIVNLVGHVLEVHRDPAPSADAPYGWRFSTQRRLGAPRACPMLLGAWPTLPPPPATVAPSVGSCPRDRISQTQTPAVPGADATARGGQYAQRRDAYPTLLVPCFACLPRGYLKTVPKDLWKGGR